MKLIGYVSYDKTGRAKYHKTVLGAKVRSILHGRKGDVDVHLKDKKGKDVYGSLDYYNSAKKSKLFNS